MIVAKLGGSLAQGDALPRWLRALERGGGCCVVVPGGGVFADAVRAEQRRHRFSDGAAHRMALLAMELYALMLADLAPSLVPCRTLPEMRDALGAGATPVWLPSAMALGDPAMAESWDVTSDSLACWLAEELCARRLVLVKSAEPPGNDRRAEALAKAGYVDAAFPGFLKRFRGGAACIAAADHAAAEAAIAAGRDFGVPIEPA